MIRTVGKRVKVVAPPEYPDVPAEYGIIRETPKGVFAHMGGGTYGVEREEDGLVYQVHASQIEEA